MQQNFKAASLLRLTDAGLPVPPGAVLTTAFFAPWFEAVTASAEWSSVVDGGLAPAACARVQELAAALSQFEELKALASAAGVDRDLLDQALAEELVSKTVALPGAETEFVVAPGDVE